MSCNCSSYSVVDGSISPTEYTTKVYSLQCQYKDMVANLTNKWRYGIFCPEDCDKMVEARALLRLLISYRVEDTSDIILIVDRLEKLLSC